MVKQNALLAFALLAHIGAACAQTSQKSHIQGDTEINVSTQDTTAIAKGEGNTARNRIGVVQGDKKGKTKITVNAAKVTTVVSGHNKKACTNIGGIVSDECK